MQHRAFNAWYYRVLLATAISHFQPPRSRLEAAEALLLTASARRDHTEHVEAHGLGQWPAGVCGRGRVYQRQAEIRMHMY